MSIPLVQNNEKDSINTSIIAIKRNIERINMLLGLSNSEEIDTSKFATKEELQQAVTDLQPVDEVAVDNMHSVTSNAVARALEPTMEILLNGNIPSGQEYQIDTDNYDGLYIDANADSAYHYTLYIPTAILTTTYMDYWLTGFYQHSTSNMFIAIRLKKGYVKVAYVQRNGSNITYLDNVKIYGITYNNR